MDAAYQVVNSPEQSTSILDESMRGLCEFRFSATLLRENEAVGYRNLAVCTGQRLMHFRQSHAGHGEGG